jgi:hypothetical protein
MQMQKLITRVSEERLKSEKGLGLPIASPPYLMSYASKKKEPPKVFWLDKVVHEYGRKERTVKIKEIL